MVMRHLLSRTSPVILLASLLCAACATGGPHTQPDPEVAVPWFAQDDERVESAGFISETLRLHEERDGVRYTLMAFAVGETLTLGAMVKGAFDGAVRWVVGERALSFALDTAGSVRDVAVRVDGKEAAVLGQGASFRGTTWVNVELPLEEWLASGTPIGLTFAAREGAVLVLPDEGHHYRARLERR